MVPSRVDGKYLRVRPPTILGISSPELRSTDSDVLEGLTSPVLYVCLVEALGQHPYDAFRGWAMVVKINLDRTLPHVGSILAVMKGDECLYIVAMQEQRPCETCNTE